MLEKYPEIHLVLGKVPGDPVLGKYPEIQLVLEKYPEIHLVLGKVPRNLTGAGKYPEIHLVLGKVPGDPVFQYSILALLCAR